MPYIPKYCCQCGEKVDGDNRNFWTSRRFCELCATEFGIHERIPQVMSGIILLIGLFSIGTFLQKPEKPLPITLTPLNASNVGNDAVPTKNSAQVSAVNTVQQTTPPVKIVSQQKAANVPLKADLKTGQGIVSETSEKVYFCGATTKKGTMCLHRVKNGGRCWQHEGQTAQLPPEKLLAAQ